MTTKTGFAPIVFEMSDDERSLLLEALSDHAMRYKGHPERIAERCDDLAERLAAASAKDDEPPTERKPTTISTVPPSSTPPLFI